MPDVFVGSLEAAEPHAGSKEALSSPHVTGDHLHLSDFHCFDVIHLQLYCFLSICLQQVFQHIVFLVLQSRDTGLTLFPFAPVASVAEFEYKEPNYQSLGSVVHKNPSNFQFNFLLLEGSQYCQHTSLYINTSVISFHHWHSCPLQLLLNNTSSIRCQLCRLTMSSNISLHVSEPHSCPKRPSKSLKTDCERISSFLSH